MAEPLSDEGGEETGVLGDKPLATSFRKMPHTKARRFKPQARLEPPQNHWWQARKADVLTVTARVYNQMFMIFCTVLLSIWYDSIRFFK